MSVLGVEPGITPLCSVTQPPSPCLSLGFLLGICEVRVGIEMVWGGPASCDLLALLLLLFPRRGPSHFAVSEPQPPGN